MNKLNTAKRTAVVAALVEGNSILYTFHRGIDWPETLVVSVGGGIIATVYWMRHYPN
jgi:hypothetical protein